jgi:hypothetical protein
LESTLYTLMPYYLYVEYILDLFDKHMIIFTSSYVRIILFRVQIKKNDRTDARLSSSTASRNVKDLADYVTSRLISLGYILDNVICTRNNIIRT